MATRPVSCVPDRPKTAPRRPKRRSRAHGNLRLSVNCFTPGDRQAPISLALCQTEPYGESRMRLYSKRQVFAAYPFEPLGPEVM
jgi:hypothetical protein